MHAQSKRREDRDPFLSGLFSGGIQPRLFLLIALVLLPLGFLLALTNFQRYLSMRRYEMQNEMELAQAAARTFEVYVTGVHEQLFGLGQAILAFDPYTDAKVTRLLSATAELSPSVRDLSLIDAAGKVVASSLPTMVGLDLADASYVRQAMSVDGLVLSDLFLRPHDGGIPTFVIATAILDKRGTLRGVIAAGIGSENVQGLTLVQSRPEEGSLAIFDRRGTLVYMNPADSLSWETRAEWLHDDVLLQRELASDSSQVGVMNSERLGGETVAARVPVGNLGWVAGASRPTDVAFYFLRRTFIQDGLLGLGVLTLAFFLATVLARSISSPLVRLERDARLMSEGVKNDRNDVRAPSEVQSLRRSVTNMAAVLIDARHTAEEANRLKDEFMANVSHELRTPMTVILSALEILQQMEHAGDKRQLLDFAQNSSQRLLHLINDLLDFSRLGAGGLKLEDSAFNLHDCVGQAMEMFIKPGREKGLNLFCTIDPQLPMWILGDAHRLGQILINLLDNAVKFTGQGEIEIHVAGESGQLVFSVRDTGIGIPADKFEQIFLPFTQVDGSSTRQHHGTGLGLAICKDLARLMGGDISVASEPGRGSVFKLRIPLRRAEQKSVNCEVVPV